ncbi:MAG TPA: hypothetical protein VHT91_47620 [Kofleriaceae bacterium]|jgi:Zn-dependent alcohol dehydrogenase|nr:hypothetical protein [Kofleriaceae bacterium]
MAPDRCCGAAGPRRRRARLAWTVVPWIALAALPKCPLCIVAYLCAIGVSAGIAAPLASAALPAARVAAVVALAAVAVAVVRAARRARHRSLRVCRA